MNDGSSIYARLPHHQEAIISAERKVVVITGASQRIGAGLVQGFLDRDYRVVANSRSIQPSVSEDLTGHRRRHCRSGGRRSRNRWRGRDIWPGRYAGQQRRHLYIAKPSKKYTEADSTAKIAVNLAGFFYVPQRASRQVLQQGGGHLINITTTLVDQPVKGVPSTLASLTKGGLGAVPKSLAIEYADQGIRVNAVAPGVIKTPMHAAETHAFLAGLRPLGQMSEIKEIVEAVLYLKSTAFVTGETLHVDGGAHAGHW